MKPLTLLAALAALSSLPAAADTVTLPPGLWSYEGEANMGPARLRDSGTECMTHGRSTYDLNALARSIAPGCALTGASSLGHGVLFSLACTGDVKGELSGQFSFTEKGATLVASGWTGDPASPLELSVVASAERVSTDCS